MWEYCSELDEASVTKIEGNVLFACNSEDLKYQYISKLSGDKDVIVKTDKEGKASLCEYNIESGFSSAYTDFSNMATLKTLDEIYIGLKLGGAVELKVEGEKTKGVTTIFNNEEKYQVTKIILPIKSTNRVKISLNSKDTFAVGGILFKYRPI